ncbi:bifunctional phosphoglucose/phosphomannose isomerase [Candidatus Woesearchaeota archaeon]|nr:bifunctional phosphoglucose/phosphomannose isomerase [Candidatus Woesearchaeota archaeon]
MDDKMLIDESDMKSILEKFPDMIKESLNLAGDLAVDRDKKSVCVTGMGGSAFSGDLLKAYLEEIEIPIFVNKTYTLPKHIDRNSLVFAVSYSGNTEETISSYRNAIKKGIKPIAISSGGKLRKLSEINENPFIKIPEGYPPRLSTPFLFFPMLSVLENSGIIKSRDNAINMTIDSIRSADYKERAKIIAQRMKDKIPIIYSSMKNFCVAEKWKTDINENAKAMAFYNMFPEFNHNEICAYTNIVGDYFVLIIKDEKDHERVKKRIKIIKELIKKRGIHVMEIAIRGEHYLSRLLSPLYLGLWVSYFLALEYETDPTPVKIIEDLKKELS